MLKTVSWHVAIVLAALVASLAAADAAGHWYNGAFGELSAAGDLDARPFVGFLLAYAFLLPLAFAAGGRRGRYWWLAVCLLPLAVLDACISFSRAWLFCALILLGWLIGLGGRWAANRLR